MTDTIKRKASDKIKREGGQKMCSNIESSSILAKNPRHLCIFSNSTTAIHRASEPSCGPSFDVALLQGKWKRVLCGQPNVTGTDKMVTSFVRTWRF
jgi:hypothetical protein